jgi:hemerythrin-like domain-containing protein
MCDYCDCRSHPQIAALNADHDVLLAHLTDLERAVAAGDHAAAAAVLAPLHDLLHAHAGTEERGVFTQLRRTVADDTYVGRFEDEHRVLHGLAASSAGDGWRAAAAELARELREHIFREETDLFPAAHQLLSPAQWDAVDAAAEFAHTR